MPIESESHVKKGWKNRIFKEFSEYIVNVVYLVVFLGAFTWYRKLILAEYQIDYIEYGSILVESLILGKVIMIGDLMHLGRRLKDVPLFFITLYKSVVFTVFVLIFTIIEHAIKGLIGGVGATEGIIELLNQNRSELIARNLVIFLVFIPFFAFKELGQVIGENKIRQLFFRRS